MAEQAPTPNPPTPTPTPTPPASVPTIEELQEQLRQTNLKLREATAEADAAKGQLEERSRKELEEQGNYKELFETAKRDLEIERTRTTEMLIATSLRTAATAAGISDPDLVGLIPRENIRVENGMVIGVEEAVANYKTAKPLLFQKTTPGNTGSNQTPPATPDAGDRGATVKGLKPEDYRQKKSEVLSALRTVK